MVEQLAHGHHVRDQGTFSGTCVADNRPLGEAEALAAVLERYQRLRARLYPKLRLSEKHSSLDFRTYVDSDWAGDHDSRRSTSVVAVYVLGMNLQSHSRTQHFPAAGLSFTRLVCGGFTFHPAVVA